jgi:hypothetical protein
VRGGAIGIAVDDELCKFVVSVGNNMRGEKGLHEEGTSRGTPDTFQHAQEGSSSVIICNRRSISHPSNGDLI